MILSWPRIREIARREYLAIVRRKAFVFTMLGMPAYFAFVMLVVIKPQMSQRIEDVKNLKVLGIVDSSGVFANAPREIHTSLSTDVGPFGSMPLRQDTQSFTAEVRFFPDAKTAEDSLRSGAISQVLVVPSNYLATGAVRRYVRSSSVLSSTMGERPIKSWLVRGMLSTPADSSRIRPVTRLLSDLDLYTLNKRGIFEFKDPRREMLDFFLPMGFAMLLGLAIVIGGQYLLQGVSEEKESRILESLLCTVSSEDLLAGKLIGLGGAGLTLVGFWMVLGGSFIVPALAMAKIQLSPTLLPALFAYLLLGYLFYGSLMTGIGAITNNMREAQQFAFMFTFTNWVPFIMLSNILRKPDAVWPALALSLFPMTAPTTMMLRMAIPGAVVPIWQVALSIALLAGAALLALLFAARIFRIGLLMYGKTPNLPEILRWATRK